MSNFAALHKGEHMKRLSVVAISLFSLIALSGVARAADLPTKQEGRIWYDQNLTLAFTPEWSLTAMPGGRLEFFRSRASEQYAGFQFIEFFFGPNYTYKWKNFTFKGSLWYYYMGYPSRGRTTATPPPGATTNCTADPIGSATTCTAVYNSSHNLEIIPTVEYRTGRWSFYDRIIFHNTFYADVYGTDRPGLSVGQQRQGWGTVLRELAQVRYAVTDRLGVLLADEPFFGIAEDTDTSRIANGGGYKPTGYWKDGFRLNRTYVGIDFKVTPALTVTPMYMLEVGMNPVDSGDVTDMAHNLFVIVTYVAKLYEDKK
jgi:hypothetical protein